MKTSKTTYVMYAAGLLYIAAFVALSLAFPHYTGYFAVFSFFAVAFGMCITAVWALVWLDLDWRSWRTRGATCLVAGITFLVLWALVEGVVYNLWLGGDPFRGQIVGTHFYLGRGGGEMNEVSKRFWWTSYGLLTALRSLPGVFFVIGVALIYLGRRQRSRGDRSNERGTEIFALDSETDSWRA